MEGVVYVDFILSPVIEVVSPIVVGEQELAPVTEHMHINPKNMTEEPNMM
jgi:hypothetical protein